MTTKAMTTDETRLAEEIVSVLPAGSVVRVCSDDRQSIRFAVRAASLKLRSIVLDRTSLRRLIADAARAVKVEYLKRDLLRNAESAGRFRYPRAERQHVAALSSRLVSAS
ncbi:MAG: hypothetical protein JWO56_3356 [Acidobacteria bacterium]|nr:hypothetical protein [Acidobacteriota bacterium]